MFCYMAVDPCDRAADGTFRHAKGAVMHKRGTVEPPPVGDPTSFQKRMALEGREVMFSNDDLGDVIDATTKKMIHRTVVRRPGRALEVIE